MIELPDHISRGFGYPTARSVALAIQIGTPYLRYPNEDALQGGIDVLLHNAFAARFDVRREVILENDLGRVDLMVGGVAVEVKIAGRARDVAAQIERYARSSMVDELVLVTTRVDHGSGAGDVLGKPTVIVSLVGAAL